MTASEPPDPGFDGERDPLPGGERTLDAALIHGLLIVDDAFSAAIGTAQDVADMWTLRRLVAQRSALRDLMRAQPGSRQRRGEDTPRDEPDDRPPSVTITTIHHEAGELTLDAPLTIRPEWAKHTLADGTVVWGYHIPAPDYLLDTIDWWPTGTFDADVRAAIAVHIGAYYAGVPDDEMPAFMRDWMRRRLTLGQ
jgi:hypothetical protein